MYAHLRVSKHSPYVLKFPIQSATSTLHFKNLCAWGWRPDSCRLEICDSKSLRRMLQPAGYGLAIYNSKLLCRVWWPVGYRLSIYNSRPLRLVWRPASYRLAIYNSKSLRCIWLTINYMLSICIFNITTLSSYMSAVILPTINIPGRKSYEVRSFQYKNISRANHQHINLMIYTAFLNLIIFFN